MAPAPPSPAPPPGIYATYKSRQRNAQYTRRHVDKKRSFITAPVYTAITGTLMILLFSFIYRPLKEKYYLQDPGGGKVGTLDKLKIYPQGMVDEYNKLTDRDLHAEFAQEFDGDDDTKTASAVFEEYNAIMSKQTPVTETQTALTSFLPPTPPPHPPTPHSSLYFYLGHTGLGITSLQTSSYAPALSNFTATISLYPTLPSPTKPVTTLLYNTLVSALTTHNLCVTMSRETTPGPTDPPHPTCPPLPHATALEYIALAYEILPTLYSTPTSPKSSTDAHMRRLLSIEIELTPPSQPDAIIRLITLMLTLTPTTDPYSRAELHYKMCVTSLTIPDVAAARSHCLAAITSTNTLESPRPTNIPYYLTAGVIESHVGNWSFAVKFWERGMDEWLLNGVDGGVKIAKVLTEKLGEGYEITGKGGGDTLKKAVGFGVEDGDVVSPVLKLVEVYAGQKAGGELVEKLCDTVIKNGDNDPNAWKICLGAGAGMGGAFGRGARYFEEGYKAFTPRSTRIYNAVATRSCPTLTPTWENSYDLPAELDMMESPSSSSPLWLLSPRDSEPYYAATIAEHPIPAQLTRATQYPTNPVLFNGRNSTVIIPTVIVGYWPLPRVYTHVKSCGVRVAAENGRSVGKAGVVSFPEWLDNILGEGQVEESIKQGVDVKVDGSLLTEDDGGVNGILGEVRERNLGKVFREGGRLIGETMGKAAEDMVKAQESTNWRELYKQFAVGCSNTLFGVEVAMEYTGAKEMGLLNPAKARIIDIRREIGGSEWSSGQTSAADDERTKELMMMMAGGWSDMTTLEEVRKGVTKMEGVSNTALAQRLSWAVQQVTSGLCKEMFEKQAEMNQNGETVDGSFDWATYGCDRDKVGLFSTELAVATFEYQRRGGWEMVHPMQEDKVQKADRREEDARIMTNMFVKWVAKYEKQQKQKKPRRN